MDEATRCDRLILMREGAIIAQETPAGLLARTGTTNAEDAFKTHVLLDRILRSAGLPGME